MHDSTSRTTFSKKDGVGFLRGTSVVVRGEIKLTHRVLIINKVSEEIKSEEITTTRERKYTHCFD